MARVGWFYCKLLCLADLDGICILIHKPIHFYFKIFIIVDNDDLTYIIIIIYFLIVYIIIYFFL